MEVVAVLAASSYRTGVCKVGGYPWCVCGGGILFNALSLSLFWLVLT